MNSSLNRSFDLLTVDNYLIVWSHNTEYNPGESEETESTLIPVTFKPPGCRSSSLTGILDPSRSSRRLRTMPTNFTCHSPWNIFTRSLMWPNSQWHPQILSMDGIEYVSCMIMFYMEAQWSSGLRPLLQHTYRHITWLSTDTFVRRQTTIATGCLLSRFRATRLQKTSFFHSKSIYTMYSHKS